MRFLSLKLALVFGLLSAVLYLISSASASEQFSFKVPAGIPSDLWSYFVPKDNALTPAKVELGRQLFFDARLSANGKVSCASCHNPRFAFADGRKTAEGIDGRRGARNTPTLLNAMFNSTLFWDGRSNSLEHQALQPLVDENEMGNTSHEQVAKRLGDFPEYITQFQAVFGVPLNIESLAKAIAAYERTLVSANAPFDRFLQGERNAMTESAQRGFILFRSKARCSVCHSVNQTFPFFTDGNYRNTGVADMSASVTSPQDDPRKSVRDTLVAKLEVGRFAVTRSSVDFGAFRTASLRNVELTAPYFHDGSAATLADVIRYYIRGGNPTSLRDWELQALSLTEAEQTDLIEFLKALTSDDARREANAAQR